MKHEIKRILKSNGEALARSDKTLRSIFDIMFSNEGLVLCESHDGFRTKKQTYGEIKRKIKRCAAGLYSRIGDTTNSSRFIWIIRPIGSSLSGPF